MKIAYVYLCFYFRLLAHCVMISSVDDVITLWTDSKLKWTGLGLDKCNVDDFLCSEVN